MSFFCKRNYRVKTSFGVTSNALLTAERLLDTGTGRNLNHKGSYCRTGKSQLSQSNLGNCKQRTARWEHRRNYAIALPHGRPMRTRLVQGCRRLLRWHVAWNAAHRWMHTRGIPHKMERFPLSYEASGAIISTKMAIKLKNADNTVVEVNTSSHNDYEFN